MAFLGAISLFLAIGATYFLVASLTGGIAGAIVGRGREDHSLWLNAVVGVVGWAMAWAGSTVVSGGAPKELTLGLGLAALVASCGVHWLRERRSTKPPAPIPTD